MKAYGRYPSLYKGLEKAEIDRLEQFCYLSRTGRFSAAHQLWKNHFESKPSTFLLVVTYVDSILRQSNYGRARVQLENFIKAAKSAEKSFLVDGQLRLLLLMKAYCNIFTKGALRYALQEARKVWSWMAGIEYSDYDEVQVELSSSLLYVN